MKIFHVYRKHPGDTGSDIFMDELSNEMIKKGHQITILTSDVKRWRQNFDYYTNLKSKENTVRIKRVPHTILRFINPLPFYSGTKHKLLRKFDSLAFRYEHGIIRFLKRFFKLLRNSLFWGLFQDELGWKLLIFLNRESFDVIHTTCVPRSCIISSLIVSRLKNKPVIITPFYHYKDIEYFSNEKHWFKILRKFHYINVCTNAERNYLISHGVPKEKIVKIGLGIYIDENESSVKNEWRQRLMIHDDEFVVLYMNSHIDDIKKGILQVIGAALKLPSVKFVFAGNDKVRWNNLIKNHFANADLKNCHFIGYITNQEKKLLFDTVDLVVRPSINEALGIIYLEGMCYGKPVITSDIEPMREISNGVGFSVEHGNDDALIKAIRKISLDKELYAEFSNNAIKKSRLYSWNIIAEKFDLLYTSAKNRYL